VSQTSVSSQRGGEVEKAPLLRQRREGRPSLELLLAVSFLFVFVPIRCGAKLRRCSASYRTPPLSPLPTACRCLFACCCCLFSSVLSSFAPPPPPLPLAASTLETTQAERGEEQTCARTCAPHPLLDVPSLQYFSFFVVIRVCWFAFSYIDDTRCPQGAAQAH
jgi:hypothetical protein